MNRREFLRRAVPASATPLLLAGVPVRAYGRSPLFDALLGTGEIGDRVLVVVQLNGGNDGLNTVIPLDQYAALSTARGNVLIPESKVLRLTSETGLHPAMPGLHSLYRAGKLAVVQGAGYPSPNFSHFRSMDIWLTASNSNEVLSTGWIGRYLEQEYPGYPAGYPTADVPDPVAISVGSVVSPGLHGPDGPTGIAVSSTSSTYTLPGGFDIPPDSPAGHELTFIRQVAEQTQVYSANIRAAASRASNLSPLYPAAGQNSLADQLKIVARLVAGGLKTRVYIVSIGGFDTHSAQVVGGAADTGTHATLLGRLSSAVTAFQDDVERLGIADRVLGMTFSEFGRRIISNASLGTDHGASAPMFLFGTSVTPTIFGSNPLIPAGATSRDNLAMQHDFRSVYASLLRDWFGASDQELQASLLRSFPTIPVVAFSAAASNASVVPTDYVLYQNYPNPFNPGTTIAFEIPEPTHVRLTVYDLQGREVAVLADGYRNAGRQFAEFDARNLASGTYLYRLQAGGFTESRRMTLLK